MTRKEFIEMEKPVVTDDLSAALHKANREFGHNSEEYFDSFRALWELRIPHLSKWDIENIKETAKPHTQATKGLETMAWLYDRLLMIGETK